MFFSNKNPRGSGQWHRRALAHGARRKVVPWCVAPMERVCAIEKWRSHSSSVNCNTQFWEIISNRSSGGSGTFFSMDWVIIYRKAPFLMVKSMVSCRFSLKLKPIRSFLAMLIAKSSPLESSSLLRGGDFISAFEEVRLLAVAKLSDMKYQWTNSWFAHEMISIQYMIYIYNPICIYKYICLFILL